MTLSGWRFRLWLWRGNVLHSKWWRRFVCVVSGTHDWRFLHRDGGNVEWCTRCAAARAEEWP